MTDQAPQGGKMPPCGCAYAAAAFLSPQADGQKKESTSMKFFNRKTTALALGTLLLFSATGLAGCGTSIAERRTDNSSTLYVGEVSSAFPTSFMPWLSRDSVATTVASMIYSTLFTFDEETGEYLPSIGKDWCYTDLEGNELRTAEGEIDYKAVEQYYSQTSEDYMVVKVTLFDNATWSDGEPVTVEDVYYTFDIGTDNALSNHAGALAWTADLKHKSEKGELKTQGMFTYERNDYWSPYPISEEEKDTVIYLRVSKVLGAVATLFTSVLILPEHIWQPLVSETQQLNTPDPKGEMLVQYENPVGCGAWTLDASQSGRQMIVLRNRGEEYHLKAEDGTALYKADTIKFVLYMDENTAIYALLKGYVDMLDKSMSSNYLRLFEKEENIQVLNVEGTSTQTLVMNVNPQGNYKTAMREILTDKNVRQAIALAINQEELVSKVLNGAGSTASAGLMLESQTELYNPDADILSGDYEDRVRQANEILDAIYPDKDSAGYRLANGKRISFEILANAGELELVSFLQVQLQKIGIEVSYKAEGSMPEDTYLFEGDFDMTFQATIFNVSNVDIMYKSHFITLKDSSNYGKLVDADLDAMIEEMRTTLNQDKKYDLVKDIQTAIAQLYYKVPVYSSNVISVARTDRFSGYVAGPGETCFNLDTLKNLKKAV